MIEYKQFDKTETPRAIHNKILNLLEERPMERKDIYANIEAINTKIDLQLNRLMREGSVDKQHFETTWFYGLTKKYRLELHNNREINSKYVEKKGINK